MKKSLLFPVLFLILLSFVSAGLQISKIDKGSVVIKELNNPAVFEFEINNTGNADYFEIYSLLGVSMSPKGTFELFPGKNTIEVMAYPSDDLKKNTGFLNFEYQLKGKNSGIFKDILTVKIVSLSDVLEIDPEPLRYNQSQAIVHIKNRENAHLDNLKIRLKSVFFDSEKTISLNPYEDENVTLNVNTGMLSSVLAGPYVVSAEVEYGGKKAKFSGILKYLEKEGTSVSVQNEGLIVRKKTITKINEGNIATKAKINVRKDIITRLMTVYSIEPTRIDRKGLFVYYTWEKELQPTESLIVSTTTNYTFPFLLALIIVLVALFAKIYSETALTVSKRVSFVKTKGGEFALKVRLNVKAKNHVDNVQLIDSLPGLTKLYEKFGNKPDKIDAKTKRLFWNVGRLNAGEERVYSYIIYSKMSVTGRFELPAATAVFQKEGKNMEVWSNRAFFVAETIRDKRN